MLAAFFYNTIWHDFGESFAPYGILELLKVKLALCRLATSCHIVDFNMILITLLKRVVTCSNII